METTSITSTARAESDDHGEPESQKFLSTVNQGDANETVAASSADLTIDLNRTDPNHSVTSNDRHAHEVAEPMKEGQSGEKVNAVEEWFTEPDHAAVTDVLLQPSPNGTSDNHTICNEGTVDRDGIGDVDDDASDKQTARSKPLTSTNNPASVQADQPSCSQLSPSRMSIDSSKYPPSCIVQLPAGASPGDKLTIRWPTLEQNTIADNEQKRASKRLRSDDGPSNGVSDLVVKVTLPTTTRNKKKGSISHILVYAPWITTEHAAKNTLTSRQLRSIGIDGHTGCNVELRRSRYQHIRSHGEGQFSAGHSRIGDRYQVSAAQIPSSATWINEHLPCKESTPGKNEAVPMYDQMWDTSLAEEALSRGEHIYQYIDSLHSFQKARGMVTLHQSDYKVSLTEQLFTIQTRVDIPILNTTEPAGRSCQSPHVLLEGSPFSQQEQESFHEAIQQYRKQWSKIAQAVGTSVNRCLIYYYSTYKTGEGRSNYLLNKKIWEQSDECEICHDGGDLICCDGCINSYHMNCITPALKEIPAGQWLCPECQRKPKND